MHFAPAPSSLRFVLGVRGQFWTERQVIEAFDWMFDRNFRRLVGVAAYRLGARLAVAAEDECQNFATGRFRRIVRLYDPARGSFEGYVVFCLKRYCGARGRALARRAAREVPLVATGLERAATTGTPETRLLRAEAGLRLRRAFASLSARDRSLLEMELADLSVSERALVLGVPSHNALTTAAHRARRRLRVKLVIDGGHIETTGAFGMRGAR